MDLFHLNSLWVGLGSVLSPCQLITCCAWLGCGSSEAGGGGGGQALVGNLGGARLPRSLCDNRESHELHLQLEKSLTLQQQQQQHLWVQPGKESSSRRGAGCSHPPPGALGTAAHLRAQPGHESSTPGTNHHPGHRGKLCPRLMGPATLRGPSPVTRHLIKDARALTRSR